jgi:hypothetical protein
MGEQQLIHTVQYLLQLNILMVGAERVCCECRKWSAIHVTKLPPLTENQLIHTA